MKKGLLSISLLSAAFLLAACGESSPQSSKGAVSSSTLGGTSSAQTGESSTSKAGGQGGGSVPAGNSGTGGGSVTYSGATTFSSDASESAQTYISTTSDESAVLVKGGATVNLTNPTTTKSGDGSSEDNSSFYGVNASLLNISGTANVKGGTINSTSAGSPGLCAYDAGVVYAADTAITTTSKCAGAVHVCGGGSLYGWDLTGTTAGEHSAAVRSDRGGGTIRLEGGNLSSTGTGSPAVYSAADIAIKGATLSASGSEAASIEGKNSIRLFDCVLSGDMADSNQNDNTWGVILYQSMSGDSEVGTSEFDMVGGTLDIKNGGYFHSTNTSSTFVLSDVTLSHTGNDSYEYLIRATGSSRWGDGTGPTCAFTANKQTMEGKVVYDSASTLNLYLVEGTVWTGQTEVSSAYTGSKSSSIYLDSSSKWIVTGDSEIDNLYSAGTIVDASGNIVSVKQNGVTKVTGTSSYSINVTGTYSSTADVSGASSVPSYDTYKVSKPAALD